MDQSQSTRLVTYDPIQRLPYDAWTECFKFSILDDSAGPLPYLAVSSHWCQALIGTPSLWTTIVIENGEDETARIHTFLHLSQSSLLDIIFKASIDTLLATLEATATRIRSIKSEVSHWAPEIAIFETKYPFLTLQAFGRGSPANLGLCYPDTKYHDQSLQVFNRGIGVIPTRFLLRCPNLTVISAPVDIRDYHLLNPATRDIMFHGVTPDNIHEISPLSKYRSLKIGTLVEFLDHSDIRKWSGMLEHLSTNLGACLERLSIFISSKLLPGLIQNVPLLPRLRTLDLEIPLMYQVEPNEAIIVEGIQLVHSIYLRFIPSRDQTQDSKALDTILETFNNAKLFQNFEEIYISSFTECSDSQLGSCLQSAMNAQKITVDVHTTSDNNRTRMFNSDPYYKTPKEPISETRPLTRLESLTVNCLSILDYISAARPISLKLEKYHKGYKLQKKKFRFHVAKCDDDGMLSRLDPVNQEELLQDCHTIVFRGLFKPKASMIFGELADLDLSAYRTDYQRNKVLSKRHPMETRDVPSPSYYQNEQLSILGAALFTHAPASSRQRYSDQEACLTKPPLRIHTISHNSTS